MSSPPNIKCQHLGSLSPPLLVFGGCFSNLQATTALKAMAEHLAIPAANCLCTGDILAYCAHPAETAALIQEWGIPLIKGNVEAALAENEQSCGCGFTPGSQCDTLSRDWFAYTNSQIDEETRLWLRQLPDELSFDLAGFKVTLVHGAPAHVSRFIFPSLPDEIFEAQFNLRDADIILAGHAGLPFTRLLPGAKSNQSPRLWHNSGALGMPANDGTPRTWATLITSEGDDLIFTPTPLSYAAEAAASAMAAHFLAPPYAACLESGLWPSLDILPEEEKRATGQPLSPKPTRLSSLKVSSSNQS